MNKLSLATLSLGALLAPAAAAAQTVIYTPWGAPPPVVYVVPQTVPSFEAPAAGARLRFGVAGNLTFGRAVSRAERINAGVLAPGITLDLGAQLDDRLAVYARASVASLLVMNQASLYGVVEYSPSAGVSLGTGVGWDGMMNTFGANEDVACCSRDYTPTRGSWGGVSFPVIVGFNVGGRTPGSARRRALRVGLEGAVGVQPSSGAAGWHAALSIGYVSM